MSERLATIAALSRWLSHVHVFHWQGTDRLPLEGGKSDWQQYIRALNQTEETRYLFLEFVKDDCPEQFIKDAQTLRGLVKHINHS